MRVQRLLLFLFLFLTSCLPLQHQPSLPSIHRMVYLDWKFSSVEEGRINAALQEWQIKTHGTILFEVHYGADPRLMKSRLHDESVLFIIRAKPWDPKVRELDLRENSTVVGLYNPTEHNIYLVMERVIDAEYLQGVALHEIGHSLGLAHNHRQEKTNMFPYMDKSSRHLEKQDIRDFCQLHHCHFTP